MQVRTNLPTISGRFRSADMMMDRMRKSFFYRKDKKNLRFIHIVFLKAHCIDWGILKKKVNRKYSNSGLTHCLSATSNLKKGLVMSNRKVAHRMTLTLFCVSWHDILFNTALGFVELGTEWLDKIRSAKWRQKSTGAYIWTSAREDIMKVVDWIPITDPVALPLYIRIRAVMLYGGHSPYPYHTQGTRVRYYDWVQQLISDSCLTIVFSPSSTSRVFDGPGCAVKRESWLLSTCWFSNQFNCDLVNIGVLTFSISFLRTLYVKVSEGRSAKLATRLTENCTLGVWQILQIHGAITNKKCCVVVIVPAWKD